MKIDDSKPAPTEMLMPEPGGVFKFDCSFYVVTDQCRGSVRSCVNLTTGIISKFSVGIDSDPVHLLPNATLLPEG